MNKRSREILSQLITKTEYSQTISIQELADMFKVSSRTIRYDIDQINDYLKENHLQPLNLGKRGVINKETHLKAMFQLVNLFYNQSFREKIKECKTGEEIYKIIEQFEYEAR